MTRIKGNFDDFLNFGILNEEKLIFILLSGFLYDHFKNYHAGYYFAGAMIFVSGVMLFALPHLIERQRKLEEKAIAERHKNESGFPEIAEEEPEKFDPDDNPQMTMEARS